MSTKKVDVISALDLSINHNLGVRQIAKIQGCSKSAIHKRIKDLLPDDATRLYQANKQDILSHMQLRLLSQVDNRRLKKLSARDAVVSYGILYDKEMLERGHSPDNKPVLVIVQGANAKVQVNTGQLPVTSTDKDVSDV